MKLPKARCSDCGTTDGLCMVDGYGLLCEPCLSGERDSEASKMSQALAEAMEN